MAENIVSGKKYKVLQDGIWKIFSLFTKASDVEFDDGMNAEEKIRDIEINGFGIELTKAEYDALSEEEQKTGTYFITDVNNEGGSGANCLQNTDVVDNLESTATGLPLSANQGRILADKLGGFSLVKISQTEYDTLTTKDENTIYFTYDE